MLIMLHIDIGPLIPFPVGMFRIPDMIYWKKIGQVNWSITINSKSSLTLSPKLMVKNEIDTRLTAILSILCEHYNVI